MTESGKPPLPAYDRHIFICVGEKCHATDGLEVYEHLKRKLKENASDPAVKRIKRSQSKCLEICQKGPIGVVYPEGVWYCGLNKEKIDIIFEQHLKQGKPVGEWTFGSESDPGRIP